MIKVEIIKTLLNGEDLLILDEPTSVLTHQEIKELIEILRRKGKTRFGFPGTDPLPDAAILSVLPGSRIHYATLILAIVCSVGLCVLIYRTRFGYEARVVGENPDAGKYAGINFLKTSLILMAIGPVTAFIVTMTTGYPWFGVLAAMAAGFSVSFIHAFASVPLPFLSDLPWIGKALFHQTPFLYLSISYSSSWVEGMTAGRGWIAIILTIFALWNPGRAIFASFLFGGIFVLQYLLQPLGISPDFLVMLPYLSTLIILLGISFKDPKRLNAPAWLGRSYKRGER